MSTKTAAKPKTAKYHLVSYFELSCPGCSQALDGPSGSQVIEIGEVVAGDLLYCYVCKVDVKVPARVGGAR